MKTTTRKAFDPTTGEECKIELPTLEEVRQAILKLDYPFDGIRIKDAAVALAEKFQLSNEQRNAENSHGGKVFYHDMVYPQFSNLLEKKELEQPGGPKTPYFLAASTPQPSPVEPDLQPDPDLTPEESIEENYGQITKELAAELLQQIKDNTSTFFEELVIDLLVAMGYGGSREDAQAVGRSRDGGIDGIINEDRLGLDAIYVQAKRWDPDKGNVSRTEIQRFAGALQGRRARKGVFITTSNFTRDAKEYVETIDSKIILIDGDQLAEFMIEHNVGVSTTKTYEIKRVDSDYFAENTVNY